MNKSVFAFLFFGAFSLSAADIQAVRAADSRNIANGLRIPGEGYSDQPYVVVASNGAWVCTLTTGKGLEGQQGQHVVATTSRDQGKTWSELVAIEPDSGPEASWVTPLITPSGRIYAFYTYNGDNIVTLPSSDKRVRADTHGWYAFRYSDDEGATWSAQRFRIPLRVTEVDRGNPWKGEVCHFWGIDKPKVKDGKVYFAFTKLGKFFMQEGEGWVVEASNILTEKDPDKLVFRLLPDGEKGIRNPALGSVQEEHNLVPLSKSDLFCVFRLESGTPGHSYSRDNGATWSLPEPMTYGPGLRTLKTPRACPKLFVTSEGKYLFWHHNHGGKAWAGRNPAFLSGGVLKEDGFIHWSEPEIALFDPNPAIRMSYPDLIEHDGKFWLTETQKTVARAHPLDRSLLDGLWNQATVKAVCTNGLVLEKLDAGGAVSRPTVPRGFGDLSHGGLTVELSLALDAVAPGQALFTTVDKNGSGVRVVTSEIAGQPTCAIELCDGSRAAVWHTDPGVVQVGKQLHLVFICDFSAAIVMVVADGVLCDGGAARQYGWGRLPLEMGEVKGAYQAELAPAVKGARLYSRPLRTSEAIGNFRAVKR
ncbi:MAG TPA: sialidase family protein [Kiritimatiellia bacterium]|nr:sialidase family protein [Kiritimatiellia bacterium]HPS06202.1 sialidase family protein [Kiritimatiellia bacterium]